MNWRKYWLENCKSFNNSEKTIFACTDPRGSQQPVLYHYEVKYINRELNLPYSLSATKIKSLAYQQKDILVVTLAGGFKEFMKEFPKEFKELKPDYSLDPSEDCKLDRNKLKGNKTPLSCRLEKDGEFKDISLASNNNLLIPEFIVYY